MGSSKMTSLKITLLPLAICLLLSLNSQVSGKPSPKHFLIETKEKAKKHSDYCCIPLYPFDNHGGTVIRNDYDINAGHFHNGPGGTVISSDYNVNSGVLNNNGGTINSVDYNAKTKAKAKTNSVGGKGKDYDINVAGSFVNHGHVLSQGGK